MINLITPPDIIYNDVVSVLLVFPSEQFQMDLQKEVFSSINENVNFYHYNKQNFLYSDTKWLLSVFAMCDIVVIDLDNCPPYVKDLASYMIAKPKTYWLTNATDTVYTLISNNRIYNTGFLSTALGGNIEKDENVG